MIATVLMRATRIVRSVINSIKPITIFLPSKPAQPPPRLLRPLHQTPPPNPVTILPRFRSALPFPPTALRPRSHTPNPTPTASPRPRFLPQLNPQSIRPIRLIRPLCLILPLRNPHSFLPFPVVVPVPVCNAPPSIAPRALPFRSPASNAMAPVACAVKPAPVPGLPHSAALPHRSLSVGRLCRRRPSPSASNHLPTQQQKTGVYSTG